jgi:hypothetical protein
LRYKIYLIDEPRIYDGGIVERKHINGAFTGNYETFSDITVFRIEDIEKVLIHESIHATGFVREHDVIRNDKPAKMMIFEEIGESIRKTTGDLITRFAKLHNIFIEGNEGPAHEHWVEYMAHILHTLVLTNFGLQANISDTIMKEIFATGQLIEDLYVMNDGQIYILSGFVSYVIIRNNLMLELIKTGEILYDPEDEHGYSMLLDNILKRNDYFEKHGIHIVKNKKITSLSMKMSHI